MTHPTKITFFERLIPSILSGKKTITIRDSSEKNYLPDSRIKLHALETDQYYCEIKILSVETLAFEDISEHHAQQEAMELSALKSLISQIYPNESSLYLITFELVDN